MDTKAKVEHPAKKGMLAAVKRTSSYTMMHAGNVTTERVSLVVVEKCDRSGRVMEWRALDTGSRDYLTVRDTVLVVTGITPEQVRESYTGSFDSIEEARAFLIPFRPQTVNA